MAPVTTGGGKKNSTGWTRGAKYLVVHRRPDYPLAGCVPAEPASVSPGVRTVPRGGSSGQDQLASRSGKVIVVDAGLDRVAIGNYSCR